MDENTRQKEIKMILEEKEIDLLSQQEKEFFYSLEMSELNKELKEINEPITEQEVNKFRRLFNISEEDEEYIYWTENAV